jgi:hypothetical protein
MAYTLNFTSVQSSSLTTLVITDTSTGGVDTNLTSRRIFLYKVDGTTLVPAGTTTDYINFPIVNSGGVGDTISVNVLSKDYSLSIYMVTTSSSPITGATYVKTNVFTATGNTNQGAYNILQTIAANPSVLNDTNFKSSFSDLYLEIENATQAQSNSDQFNAQSSLDRAYNLLTHQSLYF